MSKDIKNLLDSIEDHEKESAEIQTKLDRLTELVEKQKKIIGDQTVIIESQKNKISSMYDIPEDIIELKRMIGSLRAELNDKDIQLENSRATVAEVEKEMEILKEQFTPLQEMMETKSENVMDLKSSIAEISTKFKFKEDEIKNLQTRIKELEIIEKNLREGYKEQINKIREEDLKEKIEMESKVKALESQILETKLSTKESLSVSENTKKLYDDLVKKYDNLITKYDERDKEKRTLETKIEQLNNQMKESIEFKRNHIEDIELLNRLQPLFEEVDLFKAFSIVRSIKRISMSDLKKALGIPTVTLKKHVEKLISANLLEYNDIGEVILKSDFLEK